MRILTVLATLAAAGLLAACGGDDVSDEDFVAAVTQVCEDTAEELVAIEDELTSSSSEEEGVAFIEDQLIPLFDDLQDQLAEVEAPDDKADDYESLLELASEQRDIVTKDPSALFDPESDASAELNENTEESDELSSSLGLPENCGEPGGGASGATGETGSE